MEVNENNEVIKAPDNATELARENLKKEILEKIDSFKRCLGRTNFITKTELNSLYNWIERL